MPGVPNSLASGFSDLLGEMLKPETIDGEDLWIVGPRMSGFEKQWKQVSSWILGVAFCRRVIEEMGYRWWAPVSAFNSSRRTTLTPDWLPDLPPNDCVVERTNSSILFPDYVLARTKPGASGYDISFAESKGSTKALANLETAPSDWKNQSENGQFMFRGVLQEITQYLLIATRVCPLGRRVKTRRVQVRAWNSKNPDASISFEAFRDVLVAHYFGVCERIGLRSNARLLALANYSPTSNQNIPDSDKIMKRLLLIHERLRGEARNELQRTQMGGTWIYGLPRQSIFKIGDNLITIGLSEAAANLVRALQASDQRSQDKVVRLFETELALNHELVHPNEKLFLRNDGVIGQLMQPV